MIWAGIVIFILVCVLLILFGRLFPKCGWLDKHSNDFTGFIVIGAFVTLVITPFMYLPIGKTFSRYKDVPIVALKTIDVNTVSASGFIFAQIRSDYEEYYVVMEKYDDGSYKKVYLDCAYTYIKETDECSPHTEYVIKKATYSKWWNVPWLWDYIDEYKSKYNSTIYVPVGTIVQRIGGIE